MKDRFPDNHGLSERTLAAPELVPGGAASPSLTDIQFQALEAGIARGESALVSAPTSTGKTLIGWWTIAAAITSGHRAVYLVSHRALAKQKFEEAQRIYLDRFLEGERSAIVCATGDSVEDAAGRKTNIPLAATLLIATYEKYLGCLSVGGPPRDLRDVCFVCDEVQLIGDKTRGQATELLLTLIRRAKWKQFVGLSAVLSQDDAAALSDWLGIALIRNTQREKALRVECRTPQHTYSIAVGPNFDGEEEVGRVSPNRSTTSIVNELRATPERNPIIVFCMKVDDTYDYAERWIAALQPSIELQLPPGMDVEARLLEALKRRAAYHNAELTEEERLLIEERIAAGHVDIVFATSTLAAGVNFPLGSAVFSSWSRWNGDRRVYEPIGRAEFQNMAGRVGRMGQNAAEGLVVLSADVGQNTTQARALMDLKAQEVLGVGINPDDFGNLTLQIFAGKLCRSRNEAFELISSTLTAARELARNQAELDYWKSELFANIDRLINVGCLAETRAEIVVTTFGVAVAHTGLKPETAIYFFEGLRRVGGDLVRMLHDAANGNAEDDLLFILSNAALRSPEFGADGGKPSRYINWRVGRNGAVQNPYARKLDLLLFDRPWVTDPSAANAALQLAEWAAGQGRQAIEGLVNGVRLGTIQTMARDVAWVLTGVSEIVAAVTSSTLADESKPEALRGGGPEVEVVRQLARSLRRQATRIAFGLPTHCLWLTELQLPGTRVRLTRTQMLALRDNGLTRPIDLMDGGAEADAKRRAALSNGAALGPHNQVRDAAKAWKTENREYSKRLHLKRAAKLKADALVAGLYESKGDDLEKAFEAALAAVAVKFERLDQKNKQAHPDYLVTVENFAPIVFELKSRQNAHDLVTLNNALEVLSASELVGLKANFCVTLCSPGVEPSVPATIESCGRLCVLEIADFAEAYVRLVEGSLTRDGFYNWLTTPGIALAENLPPAH